MSGDQTPKVTPKMVDSGYGFKVQEGLIKKSETKTGFNAKTTIDFTNGAKLEFEGDTLGSKGKTAEIKMGADGALNVNNAQNFTYNGTKADDKLNITDCAGFLVETNEGNDKVDVKNSAYGSINTGRGVDKVSLENTKSVYVKTHQNDNEYTKGDIVTVKNAVGAYDGAHGYIDAGEGKIQGESFSDYGINTKAQVDVKKQVNIEAGD